tara:strand:- start:230 stop:397 length:168 start_codon:yes stop_codon:yes gene_type:complete
MKKLIRNVMEAIIPQGGNSYDLWDWIGFMFFVITMCGIFSIGVLSSIEVINAFKL